VRRFSIVSICSKRLLSYFLSLVNRWFADEVGLCVDLALYVWQQKDFVWLFEHMLLLVESVRFV
jgi:hypothetical protein